MTKINLADSIMDVTKKMSDGNPGAVATILEIIEQGKSIDTESAFGDLGPLLLLDTLGIYGTDIYILYNDKCKKDVRELIMLLRAYQLGFIDSKNINT